MLQSMELQRVGLDLATEQQQGELWVRQGGPRPGVCVLDTVSGCSGAW